MNDEKFHILAYLSMFDYSDVNSFIEDYLLPMPYVDSNFQTPLRKCNATSWVDCGGQKQQEDQECQSYCQKFNPTGADAQEMVVELFRLSVPENLLVDCNWNEKGESCWKKIATDKGICYTNFEKGERCQHLRTLF